MDINAIELIEGFSKELLKHIKENVILKIQVEKLNKEIEELKNSKNIDD